MGVGLFLFLVRKFLICWIDIKDCNIIMICKGVSFVIFWEGVINIYIRGNNVKWKMKYCEKRDCGESY